MLDAVRQAGRFLQGLGEVMCELDEELISLDTLYWLHDGVRTVNHTMRLAIQYETEERASAHC